MRVLAFLFGLLLLLAGIASAVYLDLIVFLVGGIKQTVDGFNADPDNSSDVAWGLVKAIFFAGGGTLLSYFLLMLPGCVIMGASLDD